MKKFENLVSFEDFKINEEGDGAANATTAGMGSVDSSQPSSLAGDADGATDGSGDVSFGMSSKKRRNRKKGSASEVSDLRDLEDDSEILDEFPIEENIGNDYLDFIENVKLALAEQGSLSSEDVEDILDGENLDDYYEEGIPPKQVATELLIDDIDENE